MGKHDRLWECVRENGSQALKLSFDEIRDIAGTAHSFLNHKKTD